MCGGSDSQSGSFAYTGAYAEYTYQLLNNFPNYVTKDTASLYWQAQAHGRPHETWKDIGTSTFNRYLCNGAPKNGRSAQLYRLTCDWASGKSNDDDVFDAVWYGIKTGDDGYVYYPFSFDEGMPVIWETADVISHHLGRCGGFMSYMQDCLSVQSVSSKATAFTVDGQRSPTLYCFRTSTTARGGRTNHQTDFSDHAAMCQLTGGTITMVYDPSYGVARTSELAYETDAITLYYGNSTSELTNYPTAPPNPNPSGNPAGINWIRTAP
jgi:hypothetical protein